MGLLNLWTRVTIEKRRRELTPLAIIAIKVFVFAYAQKQRVDYSLQLKSKQLINSRLELCSFFTFFFLKIFPTHLVERNNTMCYDERKRADDEYWSCVEM